MTVDPEQLRRDAEEEIEAWLCELDATYGALLADAERRAGTILADAEREAAAIVAAARAEAEQLVGDAERLAGEQLDALRALTDAEREAVGVELSGLREAVTRLRTELTRVVDTAYDAMPAVEATADAIDRAVDDSEPVKRGFLGRLLRR
jgi:type II secretory pathway predicted ATPase ExeA